MARPFMKVHHEGLRVTVVIPVFNAMATLPRCLEALRRQQRFPDEAIFADNGSGDGSAGWLQEHLPHLPFSARLVRESRHGAAAARNTGVRASTGEWIAFTDADCEPEHDWIETGLRLARGEQVGALAGPAAGTMEGGAVARLMGLTTLSATGEPARVTGAGPTGTRGFATANFWIGRALFDRLGGFDERIPIPGEDYDLCARLYQAGEQVLFDPALRVRHIHDGSLRIMWRRVKAYGHAHGHLFATYGQPGWYLEGPGGRRTHLRGPGRLWINLVSAEKKMLALLLPGVFWPPLLVLPVLYLLLLGGDLRRRAARLGTTVGWGEGIWLGALLVVKSAAMTAGRLSACRRGVVLA